MSARFIGAVVVLSLALNGLPQQTVGQLTAPATYPHHNSTRPLTVHLDSIGISKRAGFTNADVQSALLPFGLSYGRTTEAGVLLFALEEPAHTTADLWTLTRQIESAIPGLVRLAGLVVRRPGDPLAFMMGNQFVVRFMPTVSQATVDSMNLANGVSVVRVSPYNPKRLIARVAGDSTEDPLQLVSHYAQSPLTLLAEPDFFGAIRHSGRLLPVDPYESHQRHLVLIDAEDAWNVTEGSSGVIVAVIDVNGFEDQHDDLKDKIHSTWDEVLDQTAIAQDEDWHGTAVAGLIAAERNNDAGVTGVCPGCSLMLIRGGTIEHGPYSSTSSPNSDMVDAIDYARVHGAHVINNSWHVRDASDIEVAVEEAIVAGVVVVQGMPNLNSTRQGTDECEAGEIASHASLAVASSTVAITTTPPADPNVHLVGDDQLSTYLATSGNCLDLLAPGSAVDHKFGIATTDALGTDGYNSDREAQRVNTYSPDYQRCPYVPGGDEISDTDYTRCSGGNSAATAIVSGVVGLVLSAQPGLCPYQVVDILRRTADKIEYDDQGTPDICTDDVNTAGYDPCPITGDSWSPTHGYGRVNALRAVQEAQATTPNPACSEVSTASAIELGTRLGFTAVLGGTDRTVANLPGSGPLALPVMYGTWLPSDHFQLELQFGGTRRETSALTERELVFALQGGMLFPTASNGSFFIGPSLAFHLLDISSGTTDTDVGAGAFFGYRYTPLPFLALRWEGRYRRWFGLELDELGIAVGVGVVIN